MTQYEFFKTARFDEDGNLMVVVDGLTGGGGGSGITIKYQADNYSDLLVVAPSPVVGELAYVEAEQGTKWMPGSLGGTYYSSGLYMWNGTIWTNDNISINAELQTLPFLTTSQIVNITTADIGATPNDTYNNIQNKINAIKRFLGDAVIVTIKFQDATYNIGANTLSFDSFVGGTVFIQPNSSLFAIQSTAGGISITENLSVLYARDFQVNCGTKVNIVANNRVYIDNSSITTTSASENAILINNSNVELLSSVFEIDNALNDVEPVLVTNNSQVLSTGCLFTSNGTSVYGLLSQYNSFVNTFSSTVGGNITTSGHNSNGSIFSIHNMIEAFDPTGSTLVSTKKSDAIKELDTKIPSGGLINVYNPQIYSGQTTNATPLTLATFSTTINKSYSIEYILDGRSTTNLGFGSNCYFKFKNVAGVVTQIGTATRDRKSDFVNSVQSNIVISGTNLLFQITGLAGTTINWKLTIEKIIVQ